MSIYIYKQFIVTNFAYGTGPYLRTTDLAIAFNDELEKVGCERMGIIVPWVYGEKQKRVMLEEFAGHEEKYQGEILLDRKLGELLRSIFYADCTYEEALMKWAKEYREVSLHAYQHLSFDFEVETFAGEKKIIPHTGIAVELNRSPRVRYNVAPAYSTTFGNIADILERAQSVPEIAVDRELLKKGVKAAEWIERNQKMRCLSWPATFANVYDMKARYNDEILVPPIAPPPASNNDEIEKGIFVTITGIPGLERLYRDAKRLGLKLYSNDIEAVPGSVYMSPHVIPNKNIILQFARAGWSSIWISMIAGTPLVVPDFDSHDDPEIYFNNKSVEELGLGIVYRGQPLEEILEQAPRIKASCEDMKKQILEKWGTLDGNRCCAKMFAEDFLSKL
ncbi:MAG: hypothetical protein Q8R30_04570 [bacterium]|nr:hypothetical protein [bacterium]MDZ4285463.1 hypothetical protein [Candidatus Sungbacteria bacterium]